MQTKPTTSMRTTRNMFTFILSLLTVSLSMFFSFSFKSSYKATTNVFPDLSVTQPLFNAFAHNDYENEKPLLDALTNGFTFIEADIHLINQNLYVSHNRPFFLSAEKTFTQLYLDPLFEIFQMNGGRIFPQTERPICLVVDVKTGAKRTFAQLQKILKPYEAMLTRWENGVQLQGAVTIMISGNRAIETVAETSTRWVCLDGRLEDIGKNYHPELMPVISDKFSKVFGWNVFTRATSREKLLQLNTISNKIHAEGKKFRLWKSPEDELLWDAMLEAGIDLINTDSLEMLSNYFEEKRMDVPLADTK